MKPPSHVLHHHRLGQLVFGQHGSDFVGGRKTRRRKLTVSLAQRNKQSGDQLLLLRDRKISSRLDDFLERSHWIVISYRLVCGERPRLVSAYPL